MATADEATTPDAPSTRDNRQARGLRSEQKIRDTHTPEAAELLIAVRRLLVSKFGEKSCLRQLAELLRAEIKENDSTTTTRKIAKRLSEQMGARARKGPDAGMIQDVLLHCVPDEQRPDETTRLGQLYQAAHGRPFPTAADAAAPSMIELTGDTDNTALRAALQQTQEDLARVQREYETLATDHRIALRAAGNLTTRATELEEELESIRRAVVRLEIDNQNLMRENAELADGRARDKAELSEMRERLARLVAFVESQPVFRNARVTTGALPSTAQSVGITPVSTAPGSVRAVASYLRTWAELGRHQIAAIAAATSLSPEVIERTLAAQDLPPYLVIAQIGRAVGADMEYLLQASMRALDETGGGPTADIAASRPVADTEAAWDAIVAGYGATADDPPPATRPSAPVPPRQRRPLDWLDDRPSDESLPAPDSAGSDDGSTPRTGRKYQGRHRRGNRGPST